MDWTTLDMGGSNRDTSPSGNGGNGSDDGGDGGKTGSGSGGDGSGDGSGNDDGNGGSGNRRIGSGGGNGSGDGSGGNGSGNGSGGNGSGGNGSDPSAAAAAAAAAVAAARRPKFHVLLASHDAAAQDLLLLRQVAWETLMLVEDNSNQRSGTMSMLPRIGTLQSANRVLMLNGSIPNTIGELLTVLDFIKQSPEARLRRRVHSQPLAVISRRRRLEPPMSDCVEHV